MTFSYQLSVWYALIAKTKRVNNRHKEQTAAIYMKISFSSTQTERCIKNEEKMLKQFFSKSVNIRCVSVFQFVLFLVYNFFALRKGKMINCLISQSQFVIFPCCCCSSVGITSKLFNEKKNIEKNETEKHWQPNTSIQYTLLYVFMRF